MLAGIKSGKRKPKRKEPPGPSISSNPAPQDEDANVAAAQRLRQSLLQGGSVATDEPSVTHQSPRSLEERGRIQRVLGANDKTTRRDEHEVVVVHDRKLPASSSAAASDQDLTIDEMVAQERADHHYTAMSLGERDARNIIRTSKRRKIKAGASLNDSDQEEEQYAQMIGQQSDTTKSERRDRDRQLGQHDKLQGITAKCWWWLESPSFKRYQLLALGNHVSLVMAPTNLALTPGAHFYLVPIQHAPSLTCCEDEVWDEILRFQASLRAMYAKQDKAVLFCETVLPSSASFWQTKMEVLVVPKTIGQDAPLFFKTALSEQADDWGTHQKLMVTTGKGLRRTVPKNFSYFYLEYDSDSAGYAQMIESNRFPRDFAIDTVGGMMQMDPVRFRRRQKTSESEERKLIGSFLDKWKAFDWTLGLD